MSMSVPDSCSSLENCIIMVSSGFLAPGDEGISFERMLNSHVCFSNHLHNSLLSLLFYFKKRECGCGKGRIANTLFLHIVL